VAAASEDPLITAEDLLPRLHGLIEAAGLLSHLGVIVERIEVAYVFAIHMGSYELHPRLRQGERIAPAHRLGVGDGQDAERACGSQRVLTVRTALERPSPL